MREAVKKSGMLSMGLMLITAGYALFEVEECWIGLAAIAVGLLLVFSSQTIHIDREEIEELKKEVSELKK